MVNRAAGRRRAGRRARTSRSLERAGAATFRGDGPDHRRRAASRSRPTTARPPSSAPGTSSSPSAPRRRSRRSRASPTRIPGPTSEATLTRELPEEPARPRRRADRLRARPGLRAVRRPDDDRPVRDRASSRPSTRATPRPSASRWSATGRVVRTGVRAVRARAGAGTDGAHVIDLDDGSTAEGHVILLAVGPRRSRWMTSGSSTTASPSRGRTPTSATGGCASRTGCGSRATRPAPSCTPTRATTRASSSSGWPSARPIVPDYRALPRATYMEPESASVGVSARPGDRRRGSTRSSASPTSRRARRATRSRPRPGT